MKRIRADQFLVEKGFFSSRSLAQAAINKRQVIIAGKIIEKAASLVASDSPVKMSRPTTYVSRGGTKLEKALEIFDIEVAGRTAVDVGSSTGGFTDCLLRHGASRVAAVDVGYGQLDSSLRSNPSVVVLERKNVRHLSESDLPFVPDLATVDVSFISARKALKAIAELLSTDADVILLVKPQFEGDPSMAKKGVVRAKEAHIAILTTLLDWLVQEKWSVSGLTHSPLKGPKGNIEFFLHLRAPSPERERIAGTLSAQGSFINDNIGAVDERGRKNMSIDGALIERIVNTAHEELGSSGGSR